MTSKTILVLAIATVIAVGSLVLYADVFADKDNKRESKFLEKYGTDKAKWSDDVWNEYEYGDE